MIFLVGNCFSLCGYISNNIAEIQLSCLPKRLCVVLNRQLRPASSPNVPPPTVMAMMFQEESELPSPSPFAK
eukprot:scaffold5882_cov100-Cylindrotheca_fusiformis.AAC.2